MAFKWLSGDLGKNLFIFLQTLLLTGVWSIET